MHHSHPFIFAPPHFEYHPIKNFCVRTDGAGGAEPGRNGRQGDERVSANTLLVTTQVETYIDR